jgi:FKBP-type peptidyl-prolyl cis-trans isomerase FkpA
MMSDARSGAGRSSHVTHLSPELGKTRTSIIAMVRILAVVLVMGIVAAACDDPVLPRHVPCNDFLLDLNPVGSDTVEIANGIRYVDVSVGAGAEAVNGKAIDVNYTLYVDETVVDSSCPANLGVFTVILGSVGSLPSFQAGIVGMQQGGIRRVLIPEGQGYTSGTLANEPLTFDIELLTVY